MYFNLFRELALDAFPVSEYVFTNNEDGTYLVTTRDGVIEIEVKNTITDEGLERCAEKLKYVLTLSKDCAAYVPGPNFKITLNDLIKF